MKTKSMEDEMIKIMEGEVVPHKFINPPKNIFKKNHQ